MKLKNKLGAIIITCLCQSVYAQSTYGITVESDGQSFNKDFSSWEQMINSWNSEDYIIVDELPYTDISEVTETLNIHGSKIIVHYDKNSSSLVFEVPTLGIRKVFDKGETRDANAEAYFQYIDENGEDILLKLFTPKLLVATTATNPVAGNPDSLMGSVVADDFDAAKEISKSSGETASTGDKPKFGAGIELGHSTVDGHQKNIMTIPLSYTHYFAKKGYNLKLTAPISYIETDGSKAYKGSLGAALNVPINKNWSVIPAVRAGAVASKDMAASALVSSASIASVYKTKVNNVNIDVTNMASLVKTSPIDIGNYGGTEYNLSNQVLKNGITAEFPTKVDLFGKPLSVETSVANTHISGDEVYVNNYNDFALSLGTPSDASADGSSQLRLGVTHTKGNHDYKATKLNFGYDTL